MRHRDHEPAPNTTPSAFELRSRAGLPAPTNCTQFRAVTELAVDRIFDIGLFFFKKPDPAVVKTPDKITIGNITVPGGKQIYAYSRLVDETNNGA